MGESRRMIDRLLGRPVEGFCYPFGNLNAGVVRAVRDAGYAYACAVNGEENWDEYTLPRIPVSERPPAAVCGEARDLLAISGSQEVALRRFQVGLRHAKNLGFCQARRFLPIQAVVLLQPPEL